MFEHLKNTFAAATIFVALIPAAKAFPSLNQNPISPLTPGLLQTFNLYTSPAKGVVVVVHGINLKPTNMHPIAQMLQREGYSVLNVALSGHRPGTSLESVTSNIWLKEIHAALLLAKTIAARENIPFYFFGYSLGAVSGLDVMLHDPSVRPDRLVLLAPAISLAKKTWFMRSLAIFPSLPLPTLIPAKYRANHMSSYRLYKALFNIYDEFKKQDLRPLNIPTLVITEPQDEVICSSCIPELAQKYGLTQWEYLSLTNLGAKEAGYHHIIIDTETLSFEQWTLFYTSVLNHLRP